MTHSLHFPCLGIFYEQTRDLQMSILITNGDYQTPPVTTTRDYQRPQLTTAINNFTSNHYY